MVGVNAKPLVFFFDENPGGLAAGGERIALIAPGIDPDSYRINKSAF
jgi:hypothetical protein